MNVSGVRATPLRTCGVDRRRSKAHLLQLYSADRSRRHPACLRCSSTMSQRFVFVETDNGGKVRSAERQTVRRHCMRLKNKQAGSRRSSREAARQEWHQAAIDCRESAQGPHSVSLGRRLASHAEQQVGEALRYEGRLPPAPPSDWALFQFAEVMGRRSQKVMHQCAYVV